MPANLKVDRGWWNCGHGRIKNDDGIVLVLKTVYYYWLPLSVSYMRKESDRPLAKFHTDFNKE
jgi:hypothetical protein